MLPTWAFILGTFQKLELSYFHQSNFQLQSGMLIPEKKQAPDNNRNKIIIRSQESADNIANDVQHDYEFPRRTVQIVQKSGC